MPDSNPNLGKKDATQAALRASIFKAVRALEERLADGPPKIADLARAAGISKYHFQRAFQAVVGETVNQHTMRLRLERGASMLKFSSWQAGEVALACGFKTQASFNRDFKKIYGMTPQQFRKAEGTVPFLRGHLRSRPESELSDPAQPIPTVHLEQWPDLTAVCLRTYGKVADVHKPWQDLLAWARDELGDGFDHARFLGLWFDDWSGRDDAHYRYDCAIVPASPLAEPPPPPYFIRPIPGGLVAVAQARGRQPALDRAWRAFATGWLPFSGYQPRGDFAIDDYPVELAKQSLAKKVSSLVTGISIRMCLPVQSEPLQV